MPSPPLRRAILAMLAEFHRDQKTRRPGIRRLHQGVSGAFRTDQPLQYPVGWQGHQGGGRVSAGDNQDRPRVSSPLPFSKAAASVQELKDLTGDPKFAEQAAREHVATQLAGADTAEAINKYVSKNADWLPGVPGNPLPTSKDAAKKVGKGQMAKKAALGAGALVGADTFYRFAFGRGP